MVAGEVRMQPQVLVLDVDGVLTTGQFLYTAEGKVMKVLLPQVAGKADNKTVSDLLKQKLS